MTDHDSSAEHRDTTSTPGMPLWVKAAAVVVAILLAVYLVLLLSGQGGEHGPGMHSSSGPSSTGEAAALPAVR